MPVRPAQDLLQAHNPIVNHRGKWVYIAVSYFPLGKIVMKSDYPAHYRAIFIDPYQRCISLKMHMCSLLHFWKIMSTQPLR